MVHFILITLTLVGGIFIPICTLGAVLIYFNHGVIGGILLVIGIIKGIINILTSGK